MTPLDALQERLARLDAIPRLGWVGEASPLTELPELASELGLPWLALKRDDLLPELHGSTKVRKLDYLLATDELRRAQSWASVGAIGSGHLVALTAAAARLDRRLSAHLFWEPASDEVLENLAFTASGPTELRFYRSRVSLALRSPGVLLARSHRGHRVIEAGATNPPGMAGLVRAGVELAIQLRERSTPPPDRVVLPVGSGGTTAGLLLGLALAGLDSVRVHAVSVVEAPFATRWRLSRLVERAKTWLEMRGVQGLGRPLPRLVLDRGLLGRRYGRPSPGSLAAVARLRDLDVPLEAVYSGKAMARLISHPPAGERVLFWLTPRRAGSLPSAPDWRERLPGALRRRLER